MLTQEHRFERRTAIITGAGGNPSLGRAYALLLAARGANVVVNNIGASSTVNPSAEIVAAEIRALGGRAVSDVHSVATPESAESIVTTALEAFGQVDILINNAGVPSQRAIDEISPAEFIRTIEVNLLGQAWMCRAVWPHMRSRRYGRIVNIASSSLAGYAGNCAYGASKGGVFSLSRALAADGEAVGIKVNAVNPGAFTRMVSAALDESSSVYKDAQENLPAALVAPVVAYLAHEDCPVTGECIEAVGGRVRRIYLSQTEGFLDRELTIESVAARWHTVMSEAASCVVSHGTMGAGNWR
jgi:NAD(P)-dependent dehydrogenase (short-subunit alcohol dehydrogenase family)